MPSIPGHARRGAIRLGMLATVLAVVVSSATGAPTVGTGEPSATTCAQPTHRMPPATVQQVTGPVPNETRDLTVARGDVAVVPLSVPKTASANVTVGREEGYSVDLRVKDGGDGRVTLLVNTYLAGGGATVASGTYRAIGEDQVMIAGGDPAGALAEGTYPVIAQHEGRTVAERTLTVTEPSVEGIVTYRAGPQVFDATDAKEVRMANRSGRVRPLEQTEDGPAVVAGETLVVRIDVPSLLGAVAAQSGETTTERFLALHDGTGPDLSEEFEIWGPCGGIVFPWTVTAGGARALADYRRGAMYVLLDTDRLEGCCMRSSQTVALSLDEESPLVEQRRYLKAPFRIAERRVSLTGTDDGVAELAADESVELRGQTNLVPGSRIAIVVESRVEPSFERRTTATVSDDGSYATAIDLSNASDPGAFTVTVAGAQFPGEIGDPPSIYWASRPPYDYTHDEVTKLYFDRLDLPTWSLLVAYEYDRATGEFREVGTASPNDDELGVGQMREGGYRLLVVHRDGDRDRRFDGPETDPPYLVGDRPVADWIPILANGSHPPPEPPSVPVERAVVPTATPTDTPTETATATSGTSARLSPTSVGPVTSAMSPGSPDGMGSTAPGAGVLLGLLSLAVAAVLAVRARG